MLTHPPGVDSKTNSFIPQVLSFLALGALHDRYFSVIK